MNGWLYALSFSVLALSAHAAPIIGQGTWGTTLQARDLDGNAATPEAYYDTDLNITWLADANLPQSDLLGLTGLNIVSAAEMSLTQGSAAFFIARMNSAAYMGVTTWRLPTARPVNGTNYYVGAGIDMYNGVSDQGYNLSASGTAYAGTTASELAHMHYVTLGNSGAYDVTGTLTPCYNSASTTPYCLTNSGPFTNLRSNDGYWTDVLLQGDTGYISFRFLNGGQGLDHSSSGLFTWAVTDGDVGTPVVPIPAAVWLFGGALGALGVARRKLC